MPTTIHIAPYESGTVSGSGTAHEPIRICGPGHTDDLLASLARDASTRYGFTLHVHGTIPMGPNWSARDPLRGWGQIPDGWSIVGDHRDRSCLLLDESAPWYQDRPDGSLLWFGAGGMNGGGWTVRDLTLDCNQAKRPSRYLVAGLRFHGNGVTVERVRVRGLRGHPGAFEAFAISCINAPAGSWEGPDGGSVFRDILLEDCAPSSFVSGLVVGYRDLGRPVAPTLVENVRYDLGSGNHLGISACLNTTFRDITGTGTKYSFYQDQTADRSPCQVSGVQILDSRLTCSYGAIEMHAFEPGDYRAGLVVRNNDFDILPEPGVDPAFLRLIDHGVGAVFRDLWLSENRIRTSHKRMPIYSVQAPGLRNVHMRFNTFPDGATRHAVKPTPESEIFLQANRGWDGQNVASLPNFMN